MNVTVMPEGEAHNWHFDDSDFVITLMSRKPEWGGNFECVPKLRTPGEENHDGCARCCEAAATTYGWWTTSPAR